MARRSGEERVWSLEEWCRRVPEWWRTSIDCRRCGEMTRELWRLMFRKHSWYIKHLYRYGYTVFEGWVIKCADKRCTRICLYPWPRNLYRTLG